MATRVVIAGCGFGGIEAAYNLKRMLKDSVDITAIDKNDTFTYLPSLPDLVEGSVRERDITIQYAKLFRRIKSAFVKAEIKSVDLKGKTVVTDKGDIKYDYLIVSLGSESAYYGIKGAKQNSFEFKSLADAKELRDHVTEMFRSQKGETPNAIDDSALRITVIGGGLTGVELVTKMKDLADRLCWENDIPWGKCELVLVDHGKILHPTFSEEVGEFVDRYFQKQGIRLMLGRAVTEVQRGRVLLDDGTAIDAGTIVWCAGIKPSGVVEQAGEACLNPKYGLILNSYLQLVTDESVFSIGDCSYCKIFEAFPILTALRAGEQAEYVTENLLYEITGRHDKKVIYDPRRFPTLISLCKGMGILEFGGFWMKGRLAWWMKRYTQRIYIARFKYNVGFLEYVDEFFVSVIESWYFMRMRRR